MQDKNTPAFPFVAEDESGMMINMGMTLRDYFAAKALPLAIQINKETNDANIGSGEWVWNTEDCDHMARVAYELADAMLKARG